MKQVSSALGVECSTHRQSAPSPNAASPTDAQIETQVRQAITSEHAFRGSTIMTSVNKGVVKPTGNVRSEAEKELVSQDLSNIDGVKTVLNNLGIVDNTFHAPAPAPR